MTGPLFPFHGEDGGGEVGVFQVLGRRDFLQGEGGVGQDQDLVGFGVHQFFHQVFLDGIGDDGAEDAGHAVRPQFHLGLGFLRRDKGQDIAFAGPCAGDGHQDLEGRDVGDAHVHGRVQEKGVVAAGEGVGIDRRHGQDIVPFAGRFVNGPGPAAFKALGKSERPGQEDGGKDSQYSFHRT